MKLFTPEDFMIGITPLATAEWVSKVANEKLERIAKDWPVVEAAGLNHGFGWTRVRENPDLDVKYRARLAFIEEIPKAECKHAPYVRFSHPADNGAPMPTMCRHCGVELVAEWKVKGE